MFTVLDRTSRRAAGSETVENSLCFRFAGESFSAFASLEGVAKQLVGLCVDHLPEPVREGFYGVKQRPCPSFKTVCAVQFQLV